MSTPWIDSSRHKTRGHDERRHSFNEDSARRALCVAGFVGFVGLALCSDANVLAKNGGVIGICFGMGFINPRDTEALRAATGTESDAQSLTGKALDEYAAENASKLFETRATVVATVEDVADHIDHAVKIAGIDHVGIGSDFDGIAAAANGLEDVSKMPALIAVLLKRGYA
jgi:membrane dipeptidase